MPFVLLLLISLSIGVILAVIDGGLLFLRKSKLAGFIILVIGLLMTFLKHDPGADIISRVLPRKNKGSIPLINLTLVILTGIR